MEAGVQEVPKVCEKGPKLEIFSRFARLKPLRSHQICLKVMQMFRKTRFFSRDTIPNTAESRVSEPRCLIRMAQVLVRDTH